MASGARVWWVAASAEDFVNAYLAPTLILADWERNSAEGAQTSRTPMSSCQGDASRRPQEPWKYLDIHFAPPLVCSQIQCIIFCGRETRFPAARGRALKGLGLAILFFLFYFFYCVAAFQPPHPDATGSSPFVLRPTSRAAIGSQRSTGTRPTSGRNGHGRSDEACDTLTCRQEGNIASGCCHGNQARV